MYSICLPGSGALLQRHTGFQPFKILMVTHDGDANQPETSRGGFVSRFLFSTDHKVIGLGYLWLALVSVFLGMAMSLVMRIHVVWPGARSEEHTSELQSQSNLVCRLLLEKKTTNKH